MGVFPLGTSFAFKFTEVLEMNLERVFWKMLHGWDRCVLLLFAVSCYYTRKAAGITLEHNADTWRMCEMRYIRILKWEYHFIGKFERLYIKCCTSHCYISIITIYAIFCWCWFSGEGVEKYLDASSGQVNRKEMIVWLHFDFWAVKDDEVLKHTNMIEM